MAEHDEVELQGAIEDWVLEPALGVARRVRSPAIDRGDLESTATLALYMARARGNISMDRAHARVLAYSRKRGGGAVKDAVRDECRHNRGRMPTSVIEEGGSQQLSRGSVSPDQHENVAREETAEILGKAIEKLPFREQQIIRMRFIDGLTEDQVANIYQVQGAAISKWSTQAFGRLRVILQKMGIRSIKDL